MSSSTLSIASGARYAPPDRAAWWVALLLSLALIGLVHDLQYATALASDAAEAGIFVEEQAEFQSNVAAAKLGRKIGLASLLLVGVYCAVTAPHSVRPEWNALSLLIGAGLLWTLASLAWSVDPPHTLRELLRLFVYLFVAAMLAWRFDPRSLSRLLIIALAICVGTAVCVEVATGGFRPWVSDYRLSGSMHSGAIGSYSMLLVVAAYAMARRERAAIWWIAFVAAAITLLLSKALASLLAASVGMATIHLLGKSKRSIALGTCCAATLLAVGVLATSSMSFWSGLRSGRVEAFGRDYDFNSFNGRVPLWNAIAQELEGRRIGGFGYGAFWDTNRVEGFYDELEWYASHAHSGYLGTVVHVGVVGLLLLLAVAVVATHRACRRARDYGSGEHYVFASWMVAAFVISLAETGFVEPRDLALCTAAIVFSCAVSHDAAGATARAHRSIDGATAGLRHLRPRPSEGRLA